MGRYALLLGTTYLGDRDLTALPAVRHDLAQVKATLDHAGEFDRVDVHVDLTRDHLTRVVEEFFGARRRGDLALLYYSGHGLLHHDRESLFLATTDTNRERLHASAVDTAAVFKDMLSRTYATYKVVVLDCCFSGAFTAGNRFRSGLREEPRGGLRHPGTFILTSSTHQRASFTQGPDRPSVFTEVLLDGMRGKAEARGDSTWLTTHDLSHYVQAELLRRGLPAPAESSEGVTEPIPIIGLRPDPAAMAREPGPGAEPGSQGPLDADRWRALVSYYVACIERSAVLGSFVDLADRERYQPMPAGAEPVLTGTGTPLHLSGELAAVAARARDGDRELRYGYPVVVRRSGSGRPGAVEFAPLLECDASVGPDGRLHTTMPPTVNLALAADCGLSSTEIDDLVTRVEETFAPGDASALAETVTQLSDVLGIPPAVPTDPRDLAGTVRAGPLRRLQNTAVLYAADAARTPAGQLLEDLRQELATKPGAIEQTALGVLTDLTPPGRPPAEPDRAGPDVTIVAPDLLNDAQERVIRAAMTSRLTIAQGPPGTGKSQLVTALVATATAAGQTVLVGSTNNPAVSEVSDRCTGLVGPGLIVRSGNKEYLAQEPQLLAGLLATHGAGRAPDDRTPAAELRLLQAHLDAARSALDARRVLERDLAELAAERLDLPEPAVALPDSEPALRDLVRHAERAPRRVRGWWSRRKLRAFGAAAPEQFSALAQRATVELRWLQARKALAALPDEHQVWAGLGELTRQRRPAVSRALLAARVAARVRDGRAILQRRCEEMSRPKPRSWSGFPRLLEALPAWAVTAMSARRLPPTPALFDLVIIDEAAACTIPAVLPMLFRAKRGLIIGDPRQLAPVVTLPEDEDAGFQRRTGFSTEWLESRRLVFSRHSAYDALAAAAGVSHLLDEHYRCHPDIVAAPNREVYQGRLIVLTDPSRLTPRVDPAVVWRHVPGQYARGTSGSGYNTAEITAAVAEVARLRAEYPDATVGMVTPLAAQAARLRRSLESAGLAEAEVPCGTAHRFQGGERNIMVISAVGANGITDRTRNWLVNQANLWNVAITRAKALLVIVGDQSWWTAQHGMLSRIATGSVHHEQLGERSTRAADALHAAARHCRAFSPAGCSDRRPLVRPDPDRRRTAARGGGRRPHRQCGRALAANAPGPARCGLPERSCPARARLALLRRAGGRHLRADVRTSDSTLIGYHSTSNGHCRSPPDALSDTVASTASRAARGGRCARSAAAVDDLVGAARRPSGRHCCRAGYYGWPWPVVELASVEGRVATDGAWQAPSRLEEELRAHLEQLVPGSGSRVSRAAEMAIERRAVDTVLAAERALGRHPRRCHATTPVTTYAPPVPTGGWCGCSSRLTAEERRPAVEARGDGRWRR